jgi:hypothetical protein
MRTGERSFGDIFYSCAISHENSYNESLAVEDDGFSLSIKATMGAAMWSNRDKPLSQEGAAETLWEILVRPLQ